MDTAPSKREMDKRTGFRRGAIRRRGGGTNGVFLANVARVWYVGMYPSVSFLRVVFFFLCRARRGQGRYRDMNRGDLQSSGAVGDLVRGALMETRFWGVSEVALVGVGVGAVSIAVSAIVVGVDAAS